MALEEDRRRAAYAYLETIARSGIIDDISTDPLLAFPDFHSAITEVDITTLILRSPAPVIHNHLTVPFEMEEEE